MNIVLMEPLGIPEDLLERYASRLRRQGHVFSAYPRSADPAVQLQRARDADAVIIANTPLSGQVIEGCPHLKFIDVAFTGVDHVDLEAARRKGAAVSNASGYSTQSVAELALCLMLSLLRNVPQVEERCRAGGVKDGLVGAELRGKTVGVVGLGAIGLRTAELCHAFGCRVAAYNPRRKPKPEYVEYLSLEELLAVSDIVSLHCPLNSSTRGLIGREQLALMKPGAFLINTARGPVADSAALAEALNSGRLAGAAVDVFETEPPLDPAHPLLHSKNTIVTPHVAFASQESMVLRAEIVFDNLEKWMAGNPQNLVTG